MNHRNSRHTVHTKPRFTFSSQSRPQLHGAETEASCNYTGEVAPGNLVNRAYIFSFLFFFFFFSFFRLGETLSLVSRHRDLVFFFPKRLKRTFSYLFVTSVSLLSISPLWIEYLPCVFLYTYYKYWNLSNIVW